MPHSMLPSLPLADQLDAMAVFFWYQLHPLAWHEVCQPVIMWGELYVLGRN